VWVGGEDFGEKGGGREEWKGFAKALAPPALES